MAVIITKPLTRVLIRIAPGETRCDVAFHSCPTTEWLNLHIANYSITFNHSVVALTDTINFTGFHPALITLNHAVVYSNILI
jgi:hypothetical protein